MKAINNKFKLSHTILVSAMAVALSGCGSDDNGGDAKTPIDDGTTPIVQPTPIADLDSATLTIFRDIVKPKWAPYNSSDIGLVTLATDSDERFSVVTEFTIADNGETVGGFTSKTTNDGHSAVDGTPFDASLLAENGTFEFDIKVITDTPAPTGWIVKFEATNGDFAEVSLPFAPSNTWSHVSIPLADMAAAQLPQWALDLGLSPIDLSDIAVVLIAPAWQTGAGAVYQLDNVGFYANEGQVSDTTPPVITLIGDAVVTIQNGTSYVDAGVTIYDAVDTGLVADIGGDVVDVDVDGSYTITYNVVDSAGNVANEVTRTVIVSSDDIQAPVISLVGDASLTLYLNESYIEYGATANDDVDGDVSADIVIDDSALDMTMAGNYQIIYTVSDMAGNEAEQVVRLVRVVDPDADAIITNGDFEAPLSNEWELQEGAGTITIVNGELVVEGISPGAPYQPRLVQSGVELTEGLPYVIRFDAMVDEARTIHIQLGELLSGAPWFNPFMNDKPVALTTSMESYEIIVTPNSNAANPGHLIFALGAGVATTVTLDNISIAEVTAAEIAPEITLLGDSSVQLTVGDIYTDAGVTATDNLDGDVTSYVVTNNPVDTSTAGVYIVTYNVTDNDGNVAKQVARTVTVVEASDESNLVPNGDFSLGKSLWNGDYEVVDGAANIVIVGGEKLIGQQRMAEGVALPSTQYTLSFDVKGTALNGAIFNGNVQSFSSTGVSSTTVIDAFVPTTEWQTMSYDFTSGNTIDWGFNLLLGPVCGAVAGCESNVFVDNIQIVEKN
ncbi:immunoglobulin-like domain-containing protein [Vibrio ulleungensis]|uniref:DUF5011 domain-containing protein n=1 Tax=Vibrio ulleungensis TaxID=2807619 RepID=A0ABS2HD19_9VIBR|nr:immunoglobulin-like domain-containing protein [Vibrio ulleungensis]MBM7035478.1 DUF5011 domain-containing protein [Vibrio ulleungensis]